MVPFFCGCEFFFCDPVDHPVKRITGFFSDLERCAAEQVAFAEDLLFYGHAEEHGAYRLGFAFASTRGSQPGNCGVYIRLNDPRKALYQLFGDLTRFAGILFDLFPRNGKQRLLYFRRITYH